VQPTDVKPGNSVGFTHPPKSIPTLPEQTLTGRPKTVPTIRHSLTCRELLGERSAESSPGKPTPGRGRIAIARDVAER
jgi:hypothetical protein